MQTRLLQADTPEGQRANDILRRCVHCGFCNATCPTYQLLGDELDGPRGRIYQIKAVLEGESDLETARLHLDRCLTCRACETTCPSGVRYSELVEIGREHLHKHLPRSGFARLQRKALLMLLPRQERFVWVARLARLLNPLLPRSLKMPQPSPAPTTAWPDTRHTRELLLLNGCVQPVLSPQIDHRLAQLLDGAGIQLRRVSGSGCCGAVSHHLDAIEQARQTARQNIDTLLAEVGANTEGVLMSASACELELREYPQLLADDPAYTDKARQLAALMRHPIDLIKAAMHEQRIEARFPQLSVAVQEPCTFQHGLKRQGQIGPLLTTVGYAVQPIEDAHLCCGSAGTYSVFQPTISRQLRRRKVECLEAGQPDLLATANIGCLHHLQAASDVPIYHWLELLQPTTRAS